MSAGSASGLGEMRRARAPDLATSLVDGGLGNEATRTHGAMWGLLRRPLRRDELRDLVGEGPEGRRAVELLDLVAERPGLAVRDASVAGGRGRGPGSAARDVINVGRILHYGSELLLRGDASAVDESEPRRPLRHRRRPDAARLPLNLYTRCAKCPAGGGKLFHLEASCSRGGQLGPAKNPTYGTNRCHLDTNKSWWAPDWLSYHTRENGRPPFRGEEKISSSWHHLLVRNADRFNWSAATHHPNRARALSSPRIGHFFESGARWRRASGL